MTPTRVDQGHWIGAFRRMLLLECYSSVASTVQRRDGQDLPFLRIFSSEVQMKSLTQWSRSIAGAVGLVVTVASAASAQSLFYNGDYLNNALSSETNTIVSQAMVYTDFVVGGSGWNVTGLFGYFSISSDLASTDAYWEIRSGISLGNGGSLLFSGTAAEAITPTGNMPAGYNEVRTDVNGLSFFLAPGTYWVGVSMIGDGQGRAFVENTDGTNGINADIDDSGFFNSSFFGEDFTAASDQDTGNEFSLGVNGTADVGAVPEPSTIAMMAVGLVGFVGTKRRRSRR
ncbi:MAG TPA: PEP-CTERM sorting domain-containing protein [Gemmatimonadales bacterium]|jgi:hypothetical protein